MNVTNKHALPAPLVQAITFDMNPREGYSVTDLISPPRMTQLTRRHWNELQEDASERIWVLLGSAVHYILANSKVPGCVQEKPSSILVHGLKITWRPDLHYDSTKEDYKVTSVWSAVFEPEGREEWHAQLNLYNYLDYLATGVSAKQLRVCAILRDWQQRKVGEYNYPALPIFLIDIPIWSIEKAEAYLKERIVLHLEAAELPDDSLPYCTEEETWAKPTTYAVKKRGRESAIRVFTTMEGAERIMTAGLYIEVRKGGRTRCKSYCSASKFCNQNKEAK